jgi:thioredoxin reductase (NADPH)
MDKTYDLIIIGAGPASLSAAIYTTREDISTLILEKGVIGGMAAVTDKIDNYPGFSDGISGLNLAEELQKQAERFGAQIDYDQVLNIKPLQDGTIEVITQTTTYIAKSILIATGTDYNKLQIPGEEEYLSRGVHYCATCDGAFYRDKRIVVVGGGNSAIQETLFLTRYASHIDLLVRSSIKASDVLQKELQSYVDAGKVTIHLNTTVKEIKGKEGLVNELVLNKGSKEVIQKTDAIFIFVGLNPNTQFLKNSINLDKRGFVITDTNLRTNIKGIFAAGDVRSGATMQIASASGEGATAALKIREYLEGHLDF